MMITIYGLPVTIKYQDLKVLIKRECNIHDFILDHLISDGDGGKKVRVGLADDAEGSHLIKCLDGYRLSGNILRLVPVGKSVPGVVQQQSYARGNFPRSDYSNIKSVETKPTSWTENQWTATANAATYYQQPQPINTQYVQPQAASQIKQFDERQPVNRLQLQANVSQNYDYPGKTNLINLGPHRNVTSFLTQNAPATSNRYITYETSEKPVLIMKDNFQGPQTTQYLSTQMINYQNQHTWTAQQTQKPYEKNTQIFDKKYEERNYPAQVTGMEAKGSFEYHGADYPKYTDKRRIISPGKLISPHRTDRHTLQVDRSDRHTLQSDRSDRHTLQSDRHTLQSDRSDRDYDRSDRHIGRPDRTERSSDRHVVRPERNMDMSSNRDIDRPYGRNIDRPTERHIEKQTGVSRLSPSRQMTDRIVTTSDMTRTDAGFSQNIHKQAPRGVSPSTRKVEYVRGRNSSMDIHASRQSPCRPRHESPQRQIRYSPRHTDKPMEFKEARVKDVRPAYEPTATKAAIYTGGYRPNIQMDIKYPREEWQNREKPFPPKNLPDDRRDIGRMQKFDIPRASEQQRLMETEKKRSRSRSSRSPRRDRSPVRLRRHSPSPRSPRRSWALEKRRSEVRDPPSPPKWAAQDSREDYKQRIKFSDREIKEPVWKDKKPDDYRKNDTRSLNEQRGRQEAAKWKPLIPPKNEETARFVDDERYRKEGNYGRKEFEGKRTLSREDSKPYTERHVKDMSRSEHDGVRYKTDLAREEFAGRIEEKKKEILHKQELLQKEIDEVYKRAVDFTKQAVLYKKVEGNNDFRYKDERSREAREHEERHKYTSEEDRRGREDLRKEMYTKPHSRVEEPKFSKSRDPDEFDRKFGANAAFKIRRMKITDHISEKIFNQFSADVSPSFKKRVREELKLSIGKILLEMFEDKDVPFIDMLVKFNASHAPKDEERIFEEVMACLPIHYRSIKRSAKDESGIPAKMPRRSADANVDKDPYNELGIKPMNDQMQEKKLMISPKELIYKKEVKKDDNAAMKEVNTEKIVNQDAMKQKPKPKIVQKIIKIDRKVNLEKSNQPVQGQLQLSPKMSHVLEEELQDVMKQVLKNLPKSANTDAERNVLGRLRKDAILELKNVLGMNITKRLLNVYNPLFVKIQFSCRPENGLLSKFIKNYNITGFKRIDRVTNTFAAKLDTIQDFDRLCTVKFFKCGSAKLTVTPCYKFKKCPNNISTIYNTSMECEKKMEDNNIKNEASVSGTSKNINQKITKVKTNENTTKKLTINTIYNKSIEFKKNMEDNKIKNDASVSGTSKNIDEKVAKVKTNENLTKKQNTTVESINTIQQIKEFYKNKIDERKQIERIIKRTKMFTNDKNVGIYNVMDPKGNEEMNDEEILELISGGVVLDECIGSDQE